MTKVYPAVCNHFGSTQDEQGVQTIMACIRAWCTWSHDDLELQNNWLFMESLLRNKAAIRCAQEEIAKTKRWRRQNRAKRQARL